VAAGLVGLTALLVGWSFWRTVPPQMGADEDSFSAVDALFTAVTARDEKLLGQCARRLNALEDAGKLPPDAAAYLAGVVEQARDGHWEAAAQRLYGFMRAQRREGTHDPRQKAAPGRPHSARK
jgi:hypothetical protein